MPRIAIDARESGTTTGRYMDKLIEYLYKLKPEFEFVIMTKPPRVDYIKKIAPTFKVVEAPYKEFTLDEQRALKKLTKAQGADLVHFCKIEQPVLYRGKT